MTIAMVAGEGTSRDRHIGRRIRGKRRALGWSEAVLAQAAGIDPELIEAYERAVKQVPAEHLVRLGDAMDVPLSYFFPAETCSRS